MLKNLNISILTTVLLLSTNGTDVSAGAQCTSLDPRDCASGSSSGHNISFYDKLPL